MACPEALAQKIELTSEEQLMDHAEGLPRRLSSATRRASLVGRIVGAGPQAGAPLDGRGLRVMGLEDESS